MPPRRLPPHRSKRRRPSRQKPGLTVSQVLVWADDFHRRTGHWPNRSSGRIPLKNETWSAINQALNKGCRGFLAGSSLAKLLCLHRGVRNRSNLPDLKEREIVQWAKVHFQRTGEWPTLNSGGIHGLPGDTWYAVNAALFKGSRGLPGGSSLARLLARRGLKRHPDHPPVLTVKQILKWADDFHARHGKWPMINSGPVDASPKDNWKGINASLRDGKRGLTGASSLANLLLLHRGVRNLHCVPDLNERDIIRWAKAHFQRTGKWPTSDAGRIDEAPGETWQSIAGAFKRGSRGLPAGSSLARLLAKHGLKRNHRQLPVFTIRQILDWADKFHVRHAEWPNKNSGPIDVCPTESWMAVDTALLRGLRGLAGGSSLSALLNEHRGIFKGKSRWESLNDVRPDRRHSRPCR